MDSALVFGWTMWAVFLLATVIYWLEISFDILSGVKILLSDAFRALACTLVTNWFLLIPDWDKLHLFWFALLHRVPTSSPIHSGHAPGSRQAADQAQPAADDLMALWPGHQSRKTVKLTLSLSDEIVAVSWLSGS